IFSTTDSGTQALFLGYQSTGHGTLSVQGTQTVSVGGGGIADGVYGSGVISLLGGATLTATSAAPSTFAAITLGSQVGGSGRLDVAGPGSTFMAEAGGAVVGGPGLGSVDVSDGGTLSVDDAVRGLQIDGTVTVDGAG